MEDPIKSESVADTQLPSLGVRFGPFTDQDRIQINLERIEWLLSENERISQRIKEKEYIQDFLNQLTQAQASDAEKKQIPEDTIRN